MFPPQVTVTRGGWKFNRATKDNSYGETLTLTNTSGATVGPVSVVNDNLQFLWHRHQRSSGGTTTCGNLTGSYYQTPTGTAMFAPRQSIPVYMVATSPTSQTH